MKSADLREAGHRKRVAAYNSILSKAVRRLLTDFFSTIFNILQCYTTPSALSWKFIAVPEFKCRGEQKSNTAI